MKNTAIRYLKGVGPSKEAAFNRAGVYTVEDLLYYFPFRYEDRRNFKKIRDLKLDEPSVVKGKVAARNLKKMPYFLRSKKVKSIFEIILEDDTGKIKCSWFNQGYLADYIKVGQELIVYGKLHLSKRGRQIISPEYEVSQKEDNLSVGRVIGVYRLSKGLSQRFMRKIIFSSLENHRCDHTDPLPFNIRKERNIPNIVKSLEDMHFPASWDGACAARERFIFEELFVSQILVYLRKAKHRLQAGLPFKIRNLELNKIRKNFSFSLTEHQETTLSQILGDLEKPYPMHRLLQGDVGCGKTVVAAFVIAACADSGYQAAFMVPTEVLAYQHKETLDRMFEGLEFISKSDRSSIRVITSSLSKKEKEDIYNDLDQGKIKVIIGTHALLQEEVKFKRLGLVVVDEQHKFGVAQRALLPKKGKVCPHCLVMSATPIPRSLALSLYGDLDLSVIKGLPRERKIPSTTWVKEGQRNKVYDFLKERLGEGRQGYIIYPVIEENEDQDLKSLKVMYGKTKKKFPASKVEMFHGRMKNEEKLKIIKAFRAKEIDILISTTVVEVGVNIENATTMIVENPERFGLAQLHQLRGRVQRSSHKPYFILISKDNLSENAKSRLKIISQESCGFKIAEEDLKLRGPGDFFGHLQHGLPDLKIANPLRDLEILKEARQFAYKVIKSDPHLEGIGNRCIKEYLVSRGTF
jgi:ATP-dependent DNA helicase RecG